MATSLDLIDNLKSLNIQAIAANALTATSGEFVDANRRQMMKGKRKTGTNIGDAPGNYYNSFIYAIDKQKKNSAPGFMNPDLNLTGSFHRGMSMQVQGEDILVDSSDSKTTELVGKYGDSIFGLGDDERTQYTEEVLEPQFNAIVEQATGLKFM